MPKQATEPLLHEVNKSNKIDLGFGKLFYETKNINAVHLMQALDGAVKKLSMNKVTEILEELAK